MLPLAIGMRVALTHKLDESPEKRLLMHSVCRVHYWVWEDGPCMLPTYGTTYSPPSPACCQPTALLALYVANLQHS